MKRLLPLLLLLPIGAGAYWYYHNRNQEKPMVFSGSVEARNIDVGSLVGGRVLSVNAKEGDVVKAGQVLVTLESDLLDQQIHEQEQRVAEAEAKLDLTRKGPRSEELARAKIEWENARRDRDRQETLWKEGVISHQVFDAADTKAETAHQAYLELERGSRIEEITAAMAGVLREKSHLQYLQRQREEIEIKATADGMIESLDLRPGDLLPANQPAVRILEQDQKWVRIFVPEPSLGLVKVGQKVTLTVDSYPGKKFAATITQINQQGEYTPRNIQTLEQRFDQVFGVKVTIDNANELKPGMAAIVQLQQTPHEM